MANVIVASCGIYRISHIASGKAYVGSAKNIERRWKRHLTDLNCGRHHSVKLQRSWSKHGPDAFQFTILELVANETSLVDREQHWIDVLDSYLAGYNSTQKASSCLGVKHSPETRLKVSARSREAWANPEIRQRIIAANTGRVISEETRAKISAAHTGKKGRKQSPETIAKRQKTMRERLDAGLITMRTEMTAERLAALQAASRTPEAKEKQRRALTGKKHPPEVIAKRAAALREHYRTTPPRPISDETRARMSAAQKGVPKSREVVEQRMATVAAKKAANLVQIQPKLPDID